MKKKRQKKIQEIITNFEIETQEELVNKLLEAGFQVTQATISRDIREMKLTKIATALGRQKYVLMEQSEKGHLSDKYVKVCKEGFMSMDMATNLMVMKTVPGMAMAVAAAIDAMKYDEVVGCIAGDDTIMIAVRSVEDNKELMQKLQRMLQE